MADQSRAYAVYGNKADGSDATRTPVFKTIYPDDKYSFDFTADNRAIAAVPDGFEFLAVFTAPKPGHSFCGIEGSANPYEATVYKHGETAPEEAQ